MTDARRRSVAVPPTKTICAACGYGAWRPNYPCNQCGGLESVTFYAEDVLHVADNALMSSVLASCLTYAQRAAARRDNDAVAESLGDLLREQGWVLTRLAGDADDGPVSWARMFEDDDA